MVIRGERRSLRAQREAFLKRAPLMADPRFRVLGRRALSLSVNFRSAYKNVIFFFFTQMFV